MFAPYFPPDQPQRFSNVHKVFGASNVAKLLNELNPSHREDAVNSLAYEAEARLRDPVYGCVGLISILQHRLKQLQSDLFNAKKELATYIGPSAMMPLYQPTYNVNPSSAGVLPYGVSPMAGPAGGGVGPTAGQLVIREPQPQHHQNAQQLIEAQQLAAREDLEMMRNWEQPQPQPQSQQFLTFNGGGGGGYEAGNRTVVASGGACVGGFNQIGGPSGVGSPSLALGGATFDHNAAYHLHATHQIQQQPQDEIQEPLLLLQQPETLQDQGHGSEVAQAIPLQPSASHGHHQLLHHHQHHHQYHHQHNQQQRSGSEDDRSAVGPSC